MITFEEACEIALAHYANDMHIDGIYKPYDIGDAWVFNGGWESEQRIGIQKIRVAKEDGAVSGFKLPSPKNFALLEAGTELQLPEKYQE